MDMLIAKTDSAALVSLRVSLQVQQVPVRERLESNMRTLLSVNWPDLFAYMGSVTVVTLIVLLILCLQLLPSRIRRLRHGVRDVGQNARSKRPHSSEFIARVSSDLAWRQQMKRQLWLARSMARKECLTDGHHEAHLQTGAPRAHRPSDADTR